MLRRFARSLASWRFVALLGAALAASSCSKEKIVVDPIDGLEGVASPSQIVVWTETPNRVATYADTLTPGPNPPIEPADRLISVDDVYLTGPGAVQGMIFDFTDADLFQVFRSGGSGFQPLKDFDLTPTKRYLFSQTDVFRFTDPRPGALALQNYVGRGIVDGATTQQSPKTNIGRLSGNSVAGNLQYTAPTGIPPDFRPAPDSLLAMAWNAYPGAAGYVVYVYQFTDQGGDEIIASGVPAPVYLAVTRDYFIGFFPAGVTSYRIGDAVPMGTRIVTRRPLINNQIYLVRVSAVNADGELIAVNGITGTLGIFRQETTYRTFPISATAVNTKPVVQPPAPARATGIPGDRPGLWLYPAGTFPRRMP